MKKLIIIYVFCFCGGLYAVAQPGSLDSSFGEGGKIVNTQFNLYPSDAVLQADGKIVMAGTGAELREPDYLWMVTRSNADGSLDMSFGNNGKVITSGAEIGARSSVARALVIQPDKKIVVAGSFDFATTHNDITLVRYNKDGGLDESFGNNGYAITDLGVEEYSFDVALQDDGKIVVTGYSQEFNNDVFSYVARYLPNGHLDENFGNNGIIYNGFEDMVVFGHIAIQNDDKILVGGDESHGAKNYLVSRYLSNGDVDSSYGENGIARLFFQGRNGQYAYLNNIGLQDDGKLIVAGTSGKDKYILTVGRFDNNGKLDSGFAVNGLYVNPNTKNQSKAYSVMIQENKKIVIAGFNDDGLHAFMAMRFTPEGIVDSSFGENGIGGTDFGNYDGGGFFGILQKDGKIIVGGPLTPRDVDYYSALTRYNGDPVNQHPLLTKIKKWIHKHILNFEDSNPNAADYVIEKSTNATGAYMLVTKINAAAVNSTYSYPLAATRNKKPETVLYRIKTVNKDSSISYTDAIADNESTTQQINKSTNQQIHIYPNPAKDKIYIQSTKEVNLRLQNSFGQIITTQKIKGSGSMDVSKLAAGIYYVVNADSGETFEVVKE